MFIHPQSVQQLMMIHDFATRYWQLKRGKWTRRKQKGLLTHCCSTKNEGLFLHRMLLCQCTLLKDVGLKSTSPSKTKVTSMYFSATQVLQQVGNLPNWSKLLSQNTPNPLSPLCFVCFPTPNTPSTPRQHPLRFNRPRNRVESLGIGASGDVHDPQTSVHLRHGYLWQPFCPCDNTSLRLLHVWYYMI